MKVKIEVKKDCFAYKENKEWDKCAALKELVCEKEVCPFYKKRRVNDSGSNTV